MASSHKDKWENHVFVLWGKRQERRNSLRVQTSYTAQLRPDLIVLLHRVPRRGESRKPSQRRPRRRREMPIGGCTESWSRRWRAHRSRRRRRAQPTTRWTRRKQAGGQSESRRCAGEATRPATGCRAAREWRRHGGRRVGGVRDHRGARGRAGIARDAAVGRSAVG